MVFNAHRAREPAFKTGEAVIVEGYLDAIALWQAGIRHVVASLGTAFTEEQVVRLWKFAPEPVICFDGDAAGVSAAHRSIDRIFPVLKSGYSFQFCFFAGRHGSGRPRQAARAGGVPRRGWQGAVAVRRGVGPGNLRFPARYAGTQGGS
ncbi:toprim domain-containing protein [Roseibium salinum]|nr:toprim domain-containing protein [Roseibium salinum]